MLLYIIAVLAALYGWGCLWVKVFYRRPPSEPGFAAVLGLAAVIFLGGALNAAGWARPHAFGALIAAGVVLAWRLGAAPKRYPAAPLLGVWLVALFFVCTIVPSSSFNYHDDFHSYLVRPLRMLQTGSLGGNIYDGLALDSAGAQAVLQGLILSYWPVETINAMDFAVCLLICGLLIIDLGLRWRIPERMILLAASLLVAINPQHVNVSAGYSSGALVLALIFAGLELEERGGRARAAAVGALAASLLLLKSTNAVFSAVFLAVLARGLSGRLRKGEIAAAAAGLALALLPWIAIYLSDYASLFPLAPDDSVPRSYELWALLGRWTVLFSGAEGFYGGANLFYTFLALLPLAVLARKTPAAVAAAASAAAASYFIGPLYVAENASLSYCCPLILAVAPGALLFSQRPGFSRQTRRAAAAAAGVLLALFGGTLGRRFRQALVEGTVDSFPRSAEYRAHVALALSAENSARVRKAQESASKPGQTIYALVGTPFQLDFRRNSVLTVSELGFLHPWVRYALGGGLEDFRALLRRRGVDVVVWERAGYGSDMSGYATFMWNKPFAQCKLAAERQRQVYRWLRAMAERTPPLYDDGRIAAFAVSDIP